jgi:hypothetical protein
MIENLQQMDDVSKFKKSELNPIVMENVDTTINCNTTFKKNM